MMRSARGRSLHVLAIGFAALPLAFAVIRATVTGGNDLRYIWVALAALGGGAALAAVVGRPERRLMAGAAVFAAMFVAATLFALGAALVLGTTLGLGIAVVATSF